jgi:hypothetical protein
MTTPASKPSHNWSVSSDGSKLSLAWMSLITTWHLVDMAYQIEDTFRTVAHDGFRCLRRLTCIFFFFFFQLPI